MKLKNFKVEKVIDNSVKKLLNEIKKGKSENLIKYLKFCSNFHRYSLGNTLLIYSQMPCATKIAGFKSWSKMGYRVKKGEKAIKIIAPSKYIYIEKNGQKIFYNKMNIQERKDIKNHKKGMYFTTVSVFDISQCNKNNKNDLEDSFFKPLVASDYIKVFGNNEEDLKQNLDKIIETSSKIISLIEVP